MTVSRQLLTNNAFGFPRGHARRVKPVALACIHICGNSGTAAMTDKHAAAQAERNYANRPNDWEVHNGVRVKVPTKGPSAHLYVARDGWAIEAIGRAYAAWSNGDVSRPNIANPGIRRVLAMRAKGYNANEGYWREYEAVGFGSRYPITSAQKQTIAADIAANAKLSGLPINRETVHGHWEINGVDRQNCPCPPSLHESFLADVIARANAILHPPVVPTPDAPPATIGARPAGATGWVHASKLRYLWRAGVVMTESAPYSGLTFSAWVGPRVILRTATGRGTFRKILSGARRGAYLHVSDPGLTWHT